MDESSKARAAFEAYYALGPGRSLQKLAQRGGTKDSPKTHRRRYDLRTLKAWSAAGGWQARVAERDRLQAEANAAAQRARITEIYAQGFAQAHERIRLLNELAETIERDLSETGLWLEQLRRIGQGAKAKTIKHYEFNDAQIAALRGLLADLAQETGGRKQTVDVNSLQETYEQRIRRQRQERGLPPEPPPDPDAP